MSQISRSRGVRPDALSIRRFRENMCRCAVLAGPKEDVFDNSCLFIRQNLQSTDALIKARGRGEHKTTCNTVGVRNACASANDIQNRLNGNVISWAGELTGNGF